MKSSWWKILLLVWLSICIVASLLPPIAGQIADLAASYRMNPAMSVPVRVTLTGKANAIVDPALGKFSCEARDAAGSTAFLFFDAKPAGFDKADSYIVEATYDNESHGLLVKKIVATNPGFTLPYILGLGERARIIIYHVPMAWMTVIAFLVSMVYGIRYLKSRDLDLDMKSAVSSGLGLLFCILATVTGSIWAKFNWGSFWNWDPRETSIFVLLLVYGAYFALRSAIDIEEKRASLSAVYSVMAFVTVPFFIFIMPRIMPGLHPGSSDDTNSGPVLSSGGMNAAMRLVLYSTLLGYIALYTWLMQLKIRVTKLRLGKGTANQE